MKMFSKSIAFASLWIVSAGLAQAQVTGVSGNVANGSQITITGAGFGTKPNGAAPYAYFDFSKNVATASSYSRNPWGAPAMGVLTTSAPAPGSTSSWRFRIGTDENEVYTGNGSGTRFNNPKISGRDLYIAYKIYFNWDGLDAYAAQTNWNMKGFRIWAAGTRAPDIYMPGYPGTNAASGDPITYAEGTDSGPLWVAPKEIHGLRKNQWKIEEVFLRQSSGVGAADGSTWMVSNGAKSNVLSNLLTRNSAYSGMYTDLFWHQMERLGFSASAGKYVAYDFVYIDDSWARVVITGASTWNDRAENAQEIQIPVTWSNGQIQAVVRAGSLGSLTGKYLYVIKADGALVSTAGYPLSGGTPAKVPSPPTGVN
jgi:hypothetical protein